MKTHENRALFSKALLKATTCLFLTAGAGVSSVWAAPEENAQATSIVQQSSTVNGKITDANGEPIIGASVVIKGTTNGTITDFDGNFMLEVPAKATLGEFYQFNLSSCIRQQNSLTAQFVSFSLSNLANIFYPPQFLQ